MSNELGTLKMRDMKMQDWKMRHKPAGFCRGWKMRDWKMWHKQTRAGKCRNGKCGTKPLRVENAGMEKAGKKYGKPYVK